MGDIDQYDQFLIRWVAKALNGKNKFSIVCENYALSIQWLPVSSQTQSHNLFQVMLVHELVQVHLDEHGDGAYHAGGHRPIQHDKRLIGKHCSINMHLLYKCCGGWVSTENPN